MFEVKLKYLSCQKQMQVQLIYDNPLYSGVDMTGKLMILQFIAPISSSLAFYIVQKYFPLEDIVKFEAIPQQTTYILTLLRPSVYGYTSAKFYDLTSRTVRFTINLRVEISRARLIQAERATNKEVGLNIQPARFSINKTNIFYDIKRI